MALSIMAELLMMAVTGVWGGDQLVARVRPELVTVTLLRLALLI